MLDEERCGYNTQHALCKCSKAGCVVAVISTRIYKRWYPQKYCPHLESTACCLLGYFVVVKGQWAWIFSIIHRPESSIQGLASSPYYYYSVDWSLEVSDIHHRNDPQANFGSDTSFTVVKERKDNRGQEIVCDRPLQLSIISLIETW